jgi:hypothetical protein
VKIITQPFSRIGSYVLYAKNQRVVFGDPPNDDLVIEQKHITTTHCCLRKSGVDQKIESQALEDLMSKVQLLTHSDALAQFAINADLFSKIKQIIKNRSSSHLRIFSINGKLRVYIFDCRMNDQKLRVARKHSLQLQYLDLNARIFRDFSFTIKSSTFIKLINDEYVIRIGDNGICSFMTAKRDINFLEGVNFSV